SLDDLTNAAVFSTLDLYRYSSTSVQMGQTMGRGAARDLATGGTPYFSLDNGATGHSQLFATGTDNGDGQQAGHWKDQMGLGLMDPSASRGELLRITPLDLLSYDVIGWDPVPEPSTCALLALGTLVAFGYRWRRQ